MKKLFLVSIALVAAFAFGAPSAIAAVKDPVRLNQSVDRNSIYIGNRIRFTIAVSAPKGCEVRFPSFNDYSIGDFEIKDSGSRVSNRLFGGKVFRQWYIVTVYSTGKQTIPPVEIKYRLKAQKDWSVRKTAGIVISVGSVLPAGREVPDIKDIKGPMGFRNVYWGILSLVIALVVFLAAAAVVYSRLKKYVPVRLPHETALEELESIRSAYLQGGDVKEFYVGVSDCVRRYIEHAFRLKAPEMTTEEFLGSLKESPALSMDQKDLLKGFMNACDMVKFAKYSPSSAEADSVYVTAKNFIHESSIILTAAEKVPGNVHI